MAKKSNYSYNKRGKKKSKRTDIEKFAYNLGIVMSVVGKNKDSKVLDSYNNGGKFGFDRMKNNNQKPKKLFG